MKVTDLKHFLNVVVFALEQLAPGGQVAVGEDAARFQQPVGVTLQKKENTKKTSVLQLQISKDMFSALSKLQVD